MSGAGVRGHLVTPAVASVLVVGCVMTPEVQPVVAGALLIPAAALLMRASMGRSTLAGAWRWFGVGALVLAAQIAVTIAVDTGRLYDAGPTVAPLLSLGALLAGLAGMVDAYRPLLIQPATRPVAHRLAIVMCGGSAMMSFTDPQFSAAIPEWLIWIAATVALAAGASVIGVVRALPTGDSSARALRFVVQAQGAVLLLTVVNLLDHRFWAVAGPTFFLSVCVVAREEHRSTSDAAGPTKVRPAVGWLLSSVFVFGCAVPLSRWWPADVLAAGYVPALVVTVVFGWRRWGRRWTTGGVDAPDRFRAVVGALPHALASRRIDVHVEPIVRLGDRRIAGYEALMRWNDDRLGTVDPATAAEAARWAGMAEAFDRYMIEAIGPHVRRLLETIEVDEGVIDVNVSPVTLQRPGFASWLLQRYDDEGWAIDGLVVEIVEQGEIDDWKALRTNVEALQAAGVLIALDDFGAGNSNLRYFTEIEPDFVKLDRSLVAWARTAAGRNLLHDVVALVRGRGSWVVAEGVDHPEVLTAVSHLGIDLAQGHLLGRSQPVTSIATVPVSPEVLRGVVARNLDAVVGIRDSVRVSADTLVFERQHEVIEIPRHALVSLELERRNGVLGRRCALSLRYESEVTGRLDSVSFFSNERRRLTQVLAAHGWR